MKNIEIVKESDGLICDNPSCDWVDMTIKEEDMHIHINAKCPKCGDIILTQEDYDHGVNLTKAINFINLLSEEQLEQLNNGVDLDLLKKFPIFKDVDMTKEFKMVINMHNGIKIVDVKNIDDNK